MSLRSKVLHFHSRPRSEMVLAPEIGPPPHSGHCGDAAAAVLSVGSTCARGDPGLDEVVLLRIAAILKGARLGFRV